MALAVSAQFGFLDAQQANALVEISEAANCNQRYYDCSFNENSTACPSWASCVDKTVVSLSLKPLFDAGGGPRFGVLSSYIGILASLTHLDSSTIFAISPIMMPSEIGKLTLLTEIFDGGLFGGQLPTQLGNLADLTSLIFRPSFRPLGLAGSLPSQLGRLTKLQRLEIRDAEKLISTLPTSLGQLTRLTSLTLVQTNIIGTVPFEFIQLTALKTLYLSSNQLSGDVSFLSALDLSSCGLQTNDATETNCFSCPIPACVCSNRTCIPVVPPTTTTTTRFVGATRTTTRFVDVTTTTTRAVGETTTRPWTEATTTTTTAAATTAATTTAATTTEAASPVENVADLESSSGVAWEVVVGALGGVLGILAISMIAFVAVLICQSKRIKALEEKLQAQPPMQSPRAGMPQYDSVANIMHQRDSPNFSSARYENSGMLLGDGAD